MYGIIWYMGRHGRRIWYNMRYAKGWMMGDFMGRDLICYMGSSHIGKGDLGREAEKVKRDCRLGRESGGKVDVDPGVWGEVADKGRSRRGREGGQETISS